MHPLAATGSSTLSLSFILVLLLACSYVPQVSAMLRLRQASLTTGFRKGLRTCSSVTASALVSSTGTAGKARHLSATTTAAADTYDSTRSTGENSARPKKFVLVTGGVISGIGKGITASSIGVLLKMMRAKPTAIKIDPYLNADAGTMSRKLVVVAYNCWLLIGALTVCLLVD